MKNSFFRITLVLAVAVMALGIIAASRGTLVQAAPPAAPQEQADNDELDRSRGLLVQAVEPDSPAAQAGIVRGDILLALGEQELENPMQLKEAVQTHEAGDLVQLTVLHGDETRTLDVTLDEKDGRVFLGVALCHAMESIMIHRADGPGIHIIEVQAGSPAEQAGLQQGDILHSIDGQELKGAQELADLMAEKKPGDRVTLEIDHPGEERRSVEVELGEHPEKAGAAYLGIGYSSHHAASGTVILDRNGMSVEGSEDMPLMIMPEGAPELGFHAPAGNGALIAELVEGGPAASAGLQQGDYITEIDGQALEEFETIEGRSAEYQPGDTVVLTIRRHGEEEALDIEVTLGEDPEQPGKAFLGAQLVEVRTRIFKPGEQDTELVVPEGLPHLDGDSHFFQFHPAAPAPEHQSGDSV